MPCFNCGTTAKPHDYVKCREEKNKTGGNSGKLQDVNQIEKVKIDKLYSCYLNGIIFKVQLDTGSDISLFNFGALKKLDLQLLPMKGYIKQASSTAIIGCANVSVCIENTMLEVQFVVVDCPTYPPYPILRRDVIANMLNASIVWDGMIDNSYDVNLVENRLKQIIGNYSHISGMPANVKPVHIDLKVGANIYNLRQKPFGRNQVDEMEKKIFNMLEKNFIERGMSEFSLPCFLRPKETKGYRLVTDYRRLNQETVQNGYPMPLIRELLQRFKGATVLTKTDYENAFFNIPVDEETGRLTSMVCLQGLFLMKVLGQGLKQSLGHFQCNMDDIYKDIKNKASYVDDMVIYDNNMEEHLGNIEKFVQLSTEKNVAINWEKSEIAKSTVTFCGFQVSGKGYRIKDAKIIELKSIKSPMNKKECEKILHMLGWIKDFVQNYDLIIEPVREVSRAKEFRWNNTAEEALRLTLEILENTEMDYFENGEYKLFTDASKGAIGSTIYCNDKIVGLFSKALDKSEQNYSMFEKEMYAIQKAFIKYGKYIGTNQVRVYCDNEASGWFLKGFGSKLTIKVKNWIDEVQQYNITYIPIEGKKNVQADLLSRLPHEVNTITRVKRIKRVDEEEAIEQEVDDADRVRKLPLYDEVSEYEGSDIIACICNQNKEVGIMIQCDLCDRWSHAECYSFNEGDIQYDFICQFCQGKEIPTIEDLEQANVNSDSVYDDSDLNLESEIVKEKKGAHGTDSDDDDIECSLLLKTAHKYHAAIGSMRILLRSYKWEGKDRDIIEFVNSCSYCVEKNNPRRSKMSLRIPRRLNEYVGLDLMEVDEDEYKYIVVIKEMFSGAVYLQPTITKEAAETFKALVGYISCFGYPQTLVYDAGTEFLGMFKKFVEKENLFTHLEQRSLLAGDMANRNTLKRPIRRVKKTKM